jgi:hypothetical protein
MWDLRVSADRRYAELHVAALSGTYSLGPAFLEAGYRGDDGRKKAAAPVGFTHAGIFAGLGAHF